MKSYKVAFLFSVMLGVVHTYSPLNQTYTQEVKSSKTHNVVQKEHFRESLITLAKSKVGAPYVATHTGPNSFDCSGYIYYLFYEHNRTLPRTSIQQSTIGEKLPRKELQRGDLLFFDTSGKGHVNHSGLYLGEDKFIHASSGKAKSVTISDLNHWYKDKLLWGVRPPSP